MAIGKKSLDFSRKSKRHGGQVPEEVLLVDDEEEEVVQEEEPVIELASPFTGDVVSPVFKGLTVIPRVGGSEVEILKRFLHYYAATAPFIGSIVTRMSFMHKKGGVLL